MDLLEANNYLNCKPSTVVESKPRTNDNKVEDDKELEDPLIYKRLVGKLVYLITKPDITHVVNHLSQRMAKHTHINLNKTHKALRYIKNSPRFGLLFAGSTTSGINTFSD